MYILIYIYKDKDKETGQARKGPGPLMGHGGGWGVKLERRLIKRPPRDAQLVPIK